jgi:hypothetical protein
MADQNRTELCLHARQSFAESATKEELLVAAHAGKVVGPFTLQLTFSDSVFHQTMSCYLTHRRAVFKPIPPAPRTL